MDEDFSLEFKLLEAIRPWATGQKTQDGVAERLKAFDKIMMVPGVRYMHDCKIDGDCDDILLSVETNDGRHYLLIAYGKTSLAEIKRLNGRWDGVRPQQKKKRKDATDGIFMWNYSHRAAHLYAMAEPRQRKWTKPN